MISVIDRITALRSESTSSIIEQQKSMIPHDITADAFYERSDEYIIDGNRTLTEHNKICLVMNYIPFKPIPEDSLIDMQNLYEEYLNLFNDNLIYPIAVFVNGRFIKWSNLQVLSQQGHYYILINNIDIDYTDFRDLIEAGNFNVNILSIPTNVEYTEDGGLGDSEDLIFAFEDDGTVDPNGTQPICILTKNPDLYHREWISSGAVNAFYTELNEEYYLDPSNVIIFKDGVYYPVTADNASTIGPFLTIDGGAAPAEGTSVQYVFTVFYNTRIHRAHNNIGRVDPTFLQPYVQQINAGTDVPAWVESLLINFELDYDSTISYDENVVKAAKTIIEYNADLFNEVYSSSTTLDIYKVDGAWVLSHLNTDGYLDIPRRRCHENDGYVIMLVNGELYKYYYTHTYYANRFRVSVQDIIETDTVEFLFFKDVCNHVLDITVNENDPYTEYATHFRNANMSIFYPETDNPTFTYPEDGLQNFTIEHSFTTDAEGKSKITYTNPFFYGKQAKVAYHNQFRYFWYKFTQENEDNQEICVDMGENFKYCPDYSKYMVFINGRYMSTDQYRLVLPVKDTTPFYSFCIYITRPIKADDFLEVFYVPILINDIVTYDQIETTGEIVVDTSKLTYALTNDTYMVWVNGKKIPADHITNVSRNKVLINTDPGSISTVCVTKYIEDNDFLTEIFQENESLWDTILAGLTHSEICAMLGIDEVVLTNTEVSVFGETYNITSVLWEVIRDWYMSNAAVDTSEPFVYDYLDEDIASAIEGEQDSGGNYILDAYNSNREDSIREREFP